MRADISLLRSEQDWNPRGYKHPAPSGAAGCRNRSRVPQSQPGAAIAAGCRNRSRVPQSQPGSTITAGFHNNSRVPQ
jgi:hypothetical protein